MLALNAEHMPHRAMLLTGASRGIGHATVKLFYQNGWRVLTVSRAAFDDDCPWPGGADDHIQADSADPAQYDAMADNVGRRLNGSGLFAIVTTLRYPPS